VALPSVAAAGAPAASVVGAALPLLLAAAQVRFLLHNSIAFALNGRCCRPKFKAILASAGE
jgi:hypothetical protein